MQGLDHDDRQNGHPATGRTPNWPRRWQALIAIPVATLMVVLDASIVSISLPHAQADLHISDANRIAALALTAATLLIQPRPATAARTTTA